ncbi:hypothetical protein BGZ72_010833, partial [Mortierella alpina]
MLLKALQWRLKFDIAELTRMNEDELERKYEGFKRQMESGKVFIYGRDKMDRSVIYVTTRLHRPHDQPKVTMEKFLVFILECGRLLMHPGEETCLVIDLAGFGMSNVDYQIRIAHDSNELQTYIDAEKLPAVYGGKVKCQFEYIPPTVGENDHMIEIGLRDRAQQAWRVLMWKIEALMRMRIECNEGVEAEDAIKEEIEETVKEIRVAFFQLRSYTCAKTMFERSEHPPLRYDGTVAWSYPL